MRMHRLQLKHYLEAAGVPEDRYLLVGVDPPRSVREGAWVVRPNERSWEVLAWRRAGARPQGSTVTFLTEAAACEYVLDQLTGSQPGKEGRDLSLAASDAPIVVGAAVPATAGRL